MAPSRELARRAFVTACAVTHTTERAAHRFGVARFLPRLHADRITHLGGIPEAEFARQLADCRSFEDARWTGHWQRYAGEHLARADEALARLGAPSAAQLLDEATATDIAALGHILAPAVTLLADRGTVADPAAVARFCTAHPESADAAHALNGLIKAMVYELAAAWPGWTPLRLQAYRRSRKLGEVLLTALAPAMDLTIEIIQIPVSGSDIVRGYLVFPTESGPVPTVLVTNGLEGTLEEVLFPLLAHRDSGFGTFTMEMPGTYSYAAVMSPSSETVYSEVIDYLTKHPRVDADRIGMMGFSFGGYWSTRMAAIDPRLKVAVSNGALTDRSFTASGSFGTPEIIVSTLRSTIGAASMADMARKLAKYSLAQHYRKINIPLLVINGSHDTLISTQDSIDLAIGAPQGQLVLYDGDDHCAMGHSEQWSELSTRFLREHLLAGDTVLR
ncbi:alpha/beta hydrolase [Mycolicibacterium aubagnense]